MNYVDIMNFKLHVLVFCVFLSLVFSACMPWAESFLRKTIRATTMEFSVLVPHCIRHATI